MQPDQQLVELGRLAVAAAKLESFTRTLLYELLDEDPTVGRAIFGNLQFRELNSRIMPLAKHRPLNAQTLWTIEAAVRHAEKGMKLRNAVLHSHWTAPGVQLGGKGSGAPTPERVTLENVQAVATTVENAADHVELAWGLTCLNLGRITAAGLPDRWALDVEPTVSALPRKVVREHRTFGITRVDLQISGLGATATLGGGGVGSASGLAATVSLAASGGSRAEDSEQVDAPPVADTDERGDEPEADQG